MALFIELETAMTTLCRTLTVAACLTALPSGSGAQPSRSDITFTYDATGRLTSARSASGVVTNEFDGAGNRIGGTSRMRAFSLAPVSAPVAGGTQCVLMGLPQAPASVAFGGVPATVVSSTATTATVIVPSGTAVGVVDVTAAVAGNTLRADAAFTYVTTGADSDGDGMSDVWEAGVGLDPADPADAGQDPDGDGVTNAAEAAAGTHPRGTSARFLAEGATTFSAMRVALANPNPVAATAVMRFARPPGADGTPAPPVVLAVPVPPMGRSTVDPATIAELRSAEFATTVESDVPLVVDRTMTWDKPFGYASHAESAMDSPATRWYFAEGAIHGGFDLFYLLLNPSGQPADVRVTYLRPTPAPPLTATYTVAPNARLNIWVNDEARGARADNAHLADLRGADISATIDVTNGVPILVERAMYLSPPGLPPFFAGHESAGIRAPASRWFLAEGATGPLFDEYVLIANPNEADASVRATYMLPGGSTLAKDYVVAGRSRANIYVNDEEVPAGSGNRPFRATSVSMVLESLDPGRPIVVERAMWWPSPFRWYEAHNAPGTTQAGTAWAVADGDVSDSSDTYILVANTSTHAARVQVTLLFEDGSTTARTFDVAAQSRETFGIGGYFPSAKGRRFGTLVESQGFVSAEGAILTGQIVVERAMYSNDATGLFWSAGSDVIATRLR